MSDLTEFLLARIAEDERRWGNPAFVRLVGPDLSEFVVRTRAECAAKRAIVEGHAESWELGKADYLEGVWRSEDHTIRLLAAVYADHPDYLEEWRP
jgi:hypothetical protein